MKPLQLARWLCLSLFLPRAASALCQDGGKPVNPVSLGIRSHYGFIIPHSQAIAGISDSNPWGIEADLAWHLTRERIWKHCYCYPRAGFSLDYFNFGFPGVLGHSVALYPYIEPYIWPKKRVSISFRFGIGPAWLTTIYDPDTNPDNFFFGSHLSFVAMLNAALNVRLTGRVSARAAFNYNHMSNGGLVQPNVGMNFPTVNAGFDYSFSEVSFPARDKDTALVLYPDDSWWDLYILGTGKNNDIDTEKHFPVIGAGITYNRLLGRMLAFNAGTEWISDFALKDKLERDFTHDPRPPPDHNRAALLVGLELLFGRFSFLHQWGIYYYAPYQARHLVYQRYGLNLRFTDRLYLGINIKSHAQVADLLDARLGIRF